MVDVKNGGGDAPSVKVEDQVQTDPTRSEDSAHDSDLPDTKAHLDMTRSKATSKAPSRASSARNSTSTAASPDRDLSSHATNGTPAPQEHVLQSQPVSTVALNSSNAPAKEPKEPKEPKEAPAAPYGTRSRNRPERTSRVNYAEDVEMDFEMAPASSNGNSSEPPSRVSLAAESGHPATASGKKGSGAAQGNASWGTSGTNPKDNPPNANIPGTSTFVATPASTPAQPPKRRKNAANHTTNGGQANAGLPSQPGARRGNNIAAANSSSRETNMMTFENTGAHLKDGCLVADSGQAISINGKPSPCLPSHALLGLPWSAFCSISNWLRRPSLSRV